MTRCFEGRCCLNHAEPVGLVEIAERLGIKRQTADQWRYIGTTFPKQRWTVGGRPAWDWSDIETWARETGRLPAPASSEDPAV
jgi:predicted DNA-binding transcriptional regulator AlpA